MTVLLTAILSTGEFLISFVLFFYYALVSLIRHLYKALKALLIALAKLSYISAFYLARILSFPFRICYPKEDFNQMDGVEFEQFCAKWLRYEGFKKIRTTSITGDFGVDLIAQREGVRYGIQCKRYRDNVGIHAVQEINAGLAYYGLEKGIVIASSGFTRSAENLAEANGIELITGEILSSSKASKLLVRTKAELHFSIFLMSILTLFSVLITIASLIWYRSFVLLPLLLLAMCCSALISSLKQLRRRKEELLLESMEESENLYDEITKL